MQGIVELLVAIGVLIWVIGPLAKWQYERDRRVELSEPQPVEDWVPLRELQPDPLASHPFYRPIKTRR